MFILGVKNSDSEVLSAIVAQLDTELKELSDNVIDCCRIPDYSAASNALAQHKKVSELREFIRGVQYADLKGGSNNE